MDIESLQIEIVSESDKATKNIDKLTKALEKLDAMGTRTGYDKLYAKLQKLSSLDFPNFSTSGGKAAYGKGAIRTKAVGSHTFTEAQATQVEIGKHFRVETVKPEMPLIGTQTTQIMERLGASQSETARAAERVSDVTNKAKQIATDTVASMEKLKSSSEKAAESVAKVEKNTEKAGKSAAKMGKQGSRTMAQSAKTILLYSVLFSAMNAVTQGVTEGLQNVARYSEEANEALTEYKTLNLELKNAVGAAAVPMIQFFYPTIALIADAAIDAANGVNMLFSALNGEKTFVKAKKYVDDYAKSLNNLKGTTGLDQINTLSKGYNYAEMFEEVEIDSGEVWDAVGGVAALTGGVLLLKGALSGVDVLGESIKKQGLGGIFRSLATSFDTGFTATGKLAGGLSQTFKDLYKSMSPVTKGLIGAGGLVAGFALAQSGGEKLSRALTSDTNEGLGGALFSLVGGVGAGIAGGAMIGGPIGAVIGGLAGLAGGVVGFMKTEDELRRQMVETAFLDNYGLNLEELAEDYADTWGEAVILGEKTREAREKIEENAVLIGEAGKQLQPYLVKLDEIGTLTESEAEEAVTAVNTMVENMQAGVNERANLVADAFKGLFTQAHLDMTRELNAMQADFLAFQTIFGDVTDQYQARITTILHDASKKDESGNYIPLTNEATAELNEALDALRSLNVDVTPEGLRYDSMLEAANAGLTISSIADAQRIIEEMVANTEAYKEGLTGTYYDSLTGLNELILQNDALYNLGKISSDTHATFSKSFTGTEFNLTTAYESSVAQLGADVQTMIEAIQLGLVKNLAKVEEAARTEWDNMNYFERRWWQGNEDYYVQQRLADAIEIDISPLAEALTPMLESAGMRKSDLWAENLASELLNQISSDVSFDDALLAAMKALGMELHVYGDGLVIPRYATGGFPEDGLFFANSSELVGQFSNGKTAVANNAQIIEGIKQGVKEANLETGGGQGGDWIIQIVTPDGTVQSEAIITAAERRNRRDGRTVIPLGV